MRLETPRLSLTRFTMADAEEVFECITPSITRYMSWEPPTREAYMARCMTLIDSPSETQLVIRVKDTGERLGVTALERPADPLPELGIWMKATAHGCGYGGEAIAVLVRWASATVDREGFLYPVAVQNTASRRIAERLGGEIIATRSGAKYDSVVYRIPALK